MYAQRSIKQGFGIFRYFTCIFYLPSCSASLGGHFDVQRKPCVPLRLGVAAEKLLVYSLLTLVEIAELRCPVLAIGHAVALCVVKLSRKRQLMVQLADGCRILDRNLCSGIGDKVHDDKYVQSRRRAFRFVLLN